jgi:hypothetical protein
MDTEKLGAIFTVLAVVVVAWFVGIRDGEDNANRTLKQEKHQMMKVLVDNGLASYTVDPNTGVASITYLVIDKKGDK